LLFLILANNRISAHIQLVTFVFLISSSAYFMYPVPLLQTFVCDPATRRRYWHLYCQQNAWSYKCANYAGVCQSGWCEKGRSDQDNKVGYAK